MAQRLKRWWDIPTLWPICFCILFGNDVADIDFSREFAFFNLLEIFGKSKVAFPDALPVITSMLQNGLKDLFRNQEEQTASEARTGLQAEHSSQSASAETRPRARSMELGEAIESRRESTRVYHQIARY